MIILCIGELSSLETPESSITSSAESSLQATDQSISSSPSSSVTSPLEDDIKMDLHYQLEQNLDQIMQRYASFVSCLCDNVKKKEITVENLRTYLLKQRAFAGSDGDDKRDMLLSEVRTKLQKAGTINEIFDLIGEEGTSYLNYDIFKFILDKYCHDVEDDDLKYPEYLKEYIEQHNVKEFFEINPQLEKDTAGYKKLQLKFDIEQTSKMVKLVNLKPAIAKILGLMPSALRLVDVEEGCVVATFLIPTFVADDIFPADKKMATHEADALRALSVLWVKCENYREVIDNHLQLEEMLRCSVCLDTYSAPKRLQCNHVFCQGCLVPLKEGLYIKCPMCRQVARIPNTGLQSDHVTEILLEGFQAHPVAANPAKKTRYCSIHIDEEVELYCETCEQLICLSCAQEGSEHQSHSYEDISEALKKYKDEITSSLEGIERQCETLQELSADVDEQNRNISNQHDDVKENIHRTFRELREILDSRECMLISELDRLTQKKIKGLDGQKDQIETSLAQLDNCLRVMKESLTTCSEGDSEVLVKKMHMVQKIEELTAPVWPCLNTEADNIVFSAEDMKTQCENYGYVFMPSLLDPSKCYVTGKGLKGALVGEESTALLQVINIEGRPCEELNLSVDCEIESSVVDTVESCSVAKKGLSQYDISYLPTIKGVHWLHVKVEGQHITGSPFSVSVKSPVEELGTPISTIHEIKRPNALAMNHKGEMVVAHQGGSVSVLGMNGQRIQSFATHGSDPSGVAVDGDGNILVTDHEYGHIQKFTAKGEFLMKFEEKGVCGVAINPHNNKVYAVNSDHVLVLNSDLTFPRIFGSSSGRFNGIACDSTGTVYVSDIDQNCIKVYTAEGTLQMTFGGCGQGIGELNDPVDVAVDSSDLVYVAERGNLCVSVFTSEGEFVTSFGKLGMGPGEFKQPCGVAVEGNGIVCVCDIEKDCIQLF